MAELSLSIIKAGDAYFNPLHIVVVDERQFKRPERGPIQIQFLGKSEPLELTGKEAEDFHLWWLQVTGQAQVHVAPPGLRLT